MLLLGGGMKHLARIWTCIMGASLPAFAEPASPAPTESPTSPAPEPSSAPAPLAPSPEPTVPPSDAPPAPPPPAVMVPPPPPPPPPCDPCVVREPEEGEGHGLLLGGVGMFDLSDLGDRLNAQGYEEVPNTLALIGGEAHGIFESGFVIGARGAALLGPDRDGPGNRSTSFSGGFGLVDAGYAFVRTPNLLLMLTAGLGGYGYRLEIGGPGSTTFDDALDDPRLSTSLSTGGLLGSLTVGFDGRIPMGRMERRHTGYFSVGVRVSGLYGPAMGDWELAHGGDADGGPESGLVGGFAALVIGFGGGHVDRGDRYE